MFPNLSNHLAYHWQLFMPIGLGRYLQRHATAFDVAHLHACRNLPGVLAARHLRAHGIPFVLSPNGTAPRLERLHRTKWVFDQVAGHALMRSASRVLAVTETERRQLLSLGVRAGAVRIVPNPIDVDECDEPMTRGRFRQRLGVGDAPLVLFLGKLTPRKRTEVLVDAFAAMGRTDARLVIAGNDMGAGRSTRARSVLRDVDHQTFFTGLLQGPERLEALADATVVVYPSEDEIFGLVPLEALLMGTPVVVADDSGCGEVIGGVGGGQVTPVGDPAALAVAIARVLDAPDAWRQQAVDAGGRVRATYSGSSVSAVLEDIYQEVREEASR